MRLPLYISVITTILAITIPLIHYISFDRDRYISDINSYSKLSTLSSVAFCVSWFEPRVKRFENGMSIKAYPQLPTPDRLTFVYGDIYVK